MRRFALAARRSRTDGPTPALTALALVAGFFLIAAAPVRANEISDENVLPGRPPSEWDVNGAGDSRIQGFATDISVNRGETIDFKINVTDGADYRIRIYRLGWYQGNGARLVDSLGTAIPFTGTVQPAPITDAPNGLVDCGNWSVSASWTVPTTAISGIYIARLVRVADGGASHIVFIVRKDGVPADLLFKTADATWQAYNVYGGNSLYVGSTSYPSGHATKVSYNRPFVTRAGGGGGGAAEDWLFNAEYPMVRWLERNGYDVSYTTDLDMDRDSTPITPSTHKIILSVGHDEYWSAAERAKFEAARGAGVHLAFFSGNEVYWKTRWENSIDGNNTPHRTLVCYKEGTLGENSCGGKCDPLPDVWTGLWRDGCVFTPPADGCNPENALSGQISWDGTTSTIVVPDTYGNLRFWRNTAVATLPSGQSLTLTPGTLGYEWDFEQYGEHYPPGRVHLSTTVYNNHTHHLSLYRHTSGALVFGAGTVQWSWGLDGTHDRGSDPPSLAMQQATLNLFADMNAQPATPQGDLVPATGAADLTAPTSTIGFPAPGASLPSGTPVTITGTATEIDGIVAGVEISVDDGVTWQRATGTTSWSLVWVPGATGSVTIKSRAFDDLGNLEVAASAPAPNAVTVTVTEASPSGPYTIFPPTATPVYPNVTDSQALELGVKFQVTTDGTISGIRFYKGVSNTGTHVGSLWSSTGVLLGQATFTGESASGWQEVLFATPVDVTTGTTYVASYYSPTGYFSVDYAYFTNPVVSGPLRALANGEDGSNGVFVYSSSGPAFPTQAPGGLYAASNYWVDVVFELPGGPDVTPPTVVATSPGNGATGVATNTVVSAVFSEPLDPATVGSATFDLRDPLDNPVLATVEYDAPSRTATLTPGTALESSTVYTARLRGGATDPRIKDLAGNPLAADYVWSFTTSVPDVTPPAVVSTVPTTGATGVSPGVVVSAVFNEALNPTSVSTSTFELRDATNTLVPATVSYNVYTRTASLTPSAPLAEVTEYTATLKGGATDPRIKDLAGNALSADYTWSFIVASFDCPCTVFQPTDLPAQTDVTDNQPIELGMKFRSSVDGYVTGVRFYKGALNTGEHIGSLWSSSGVLLSQVTFVGETASGWQEQAFDAPVPIAANTTYVISYHSPLYFADTSPYFNSAVVNGPLEGLADGEDGPNGVYVYGSSAFPTSSYNKSNYWVDLVFATSVGPDVTPPTVITRSPSPGATNVAVSASATATFSEPLDPATVNSSTFELLDPGSASVGATVSWDNPTRTATLTPTSPLDYATTYTAILRGGASPPHIKDVAGNPLAADVSWSFTTAGPPPTEGPGGPILVISTGANPFSRYYAEILRAEGMNEFTAMDLSLVTPAVLTDYDVVILGELPLGAADVTMLSDWTDAGGLLIAMRPDAQLAGLLGLTLAGGTLEDRYLLVNTASGPGVGIIGETIQFHGAADLYTLSGATSLATLYSDATTATTNPAVTIRDVGVNGGQAVAFTYDLARSVVYTRQGNPAWIGQERDGTPPIRSDDLFYGNAAGDPQPDWVDLDKVAIPQADEQQRLLANVIIQGNLDRYPLPRFWYLPRGLKAAIVMTGDDHGDDGMQPRFDAYLAQSPGGCSVDDWECVRATGYLYVGSTFTNAQAAYYDGLGFETALHINTGCASVPANQYEAATASQLATFANAFPSIPAPATNRNHCIAWTDWTTVPEIEAAYGIRLDTNYYYWPGSWVLDRSGMFTGSGIPMRFAQTDGTMIDCYQVTTQMTDESGQDYPQFCSELLDRALGAEGYYGVFATNMHFDQPSHPGSDAIVASALARDVPVVSAKQMLDWLDGRNGSAFQNLVWNSNTLSFSITTAAGSRNLRGMLPTLAAVGQLTGITRNAIPITYSTETIKGIEYAFFPAEDGDYVASYLIDTTPPLITTIVATPHGDGTATITWTTNEPADSRVDYGTDPGLLDLSEASGSLVTSHSITLMGLTANATYHYRVTSEDGAGNPTTEPAPPATLSFTMPGLTCFVDDLVADFEAGTTGADTYVAMTDDGEVILRPTEGAEFSGSALPAGWQSEAWGTGGTATVASGKLTVDEAHAATTALFGPGTSLEFEATFRADDYQNIGFASDFAFNAPWVVIGRGTGAGSNLYARSSAGETLLSASLLNTPHRYRIDWNANSFVFYVDGVQLATFNLTVGTSMVVQVSDDGPAANGIALDANWLRITPYAAAGTFTSRAYDAGDTATWGVISWTAESPAGTTVALAVRTGNTATPDGTWTEFNPVTQGATVGGASRYIQYQADLATSDTRVTPVLADVSVSCDVGPDTTPPVISNIVATPDPGGTIATITWDTDEAANSRVDYGTDPGLLDQSATGTPFVTNHSLGLTGLSPSTTYYFQVTSVDPSNNSATEPTPPAMFTTPAPPAPPCFIDDVADDFLDGTTGTDTYVAATDDGEVILKPTAGSEFFGTTMPAGWTSTTWDAGIGTSVAGGVATIDGALLATSGAPSYGPGRAIEFVATFEANTGQHIGFATDLNAPPWAIFSNGGGSVLKARTRSAISAETSTDLTGVAISIPHRFRIEWDAGEVRYFVDGTLKATHTVTVAGPMRPAASDWPGGATLALDWIRMSPYALAGTFESRIGDAGSAATWGAITWTADTPSGTGLALSVRTGDTPTPDGTWTVFNAIANGDPVGVSSRYIQYQAVLTGDGTSTPVLSDLAIACTTSPDPDPPVITNLAATVDPGGTAATITWDTDEPADSRVDYGTSPTLLDQNVTNGAFVTAHSLVLGSLMPNTTYYYRATSKDPANNSATSPASPDDPLSFTTPPAPPTACFADDTAADFIQGDFGTATYVAATGDGEVILKPTEGSDFFGTAVPAGWTSTPWSGGVGTSVAGGVATIDGALLATSTYPPAPYGPARAIEFRATFQAGTSQHVGFATDLNAAPWAIFSTGFPGGTVIKARTNGGSPLDTDLTDVTIGVTHRFRIEWDAGQVRYYVDGTLKAAHTTAVTALMRPVASDQAGGAVLTLDWIRMTPYASSGTFTSRLLDHGSRAYWSDCTWTATTPAGTSIDISVRTGDDPLAMGSWIPIAASGDPVNAAGRYIQYQAVLATTDHATTPALEDLTILCAECDATPPAAVTDLAATQVLADNDTDGTTEVHLTFTSPADAATTEIWRAPFPDYPEYAGSEPTLPTSYPPAGWTHVAALDNVADGFDEPATRGFWYYVAVTRDECGNAAISNRTAGALNYHLGDVSDGATPGQGDNTVTTPDVSLFATHYFTIPGTEFNYLDIGPTTDYSVLARPVPDDLVDFEDLVLMAINYSAVGAQGPPAPGLEDIPGGTPTIVLRTEATADGILCRLMLVDNPGTVKAFHLRLSHDPLLSVVEAGPGPLLGAQGADTFFQHLSEGDELGLHAAVLGQGITIHGTGEVARVRFRGHGGIDLPFADLRDLENGFLGDPPTTVSVGEPPAAPLPTELALHAARPNPFNPSTMLRFDLPAPARVELRIYDVAGQLVRTLVEGDLPAGEHSAFWDGRTIRGGVASSGVYLVRFRAGGREFTQKIQLLK